jgi:hypothetical protein
MTRHSVIPPAADLPNMPANICTANICTANICTASIFAAGVFAAGVFAGPHHMKNDV